MLALTLLICEGETQELAGTGGSGHFWEFIGGSIINDSIAVIANAQAANDGLIRATCLQRRRL